ncbi:MAG: hypothetical protein WCP74_06950 [Sphingobacteriia bacterium]|jgi:hypothetical protein
MKKIILLFCCIPFLLNAQSNLTGKEILHQLTIAAGGDLWQQPQSLQLSGNATWTPFGKTDPSESIHFDTYKMYRVFPSQNLAAHAANGKIRFDAKYNDSTYMQLIFDGQKTLNYLSEKAKPYQKYFSWSNNFGFGIIRFADKDSFSVVRLADDQIEGYPCYVVQITDPKKMVTTFSIDQKTFYIRGVNFITDIGFHNRIYSDFEKLKPANKSGGYFIQARRIRLYFDGIKWMDINWTNNKVNGIIQDEVFVK